MFALTSKEKNMSTPEHLCPHRVLWWQWYTPFTSVTLSWTLMLTAFKDLTLQGKRTQVKNVDLCSTLSISRALGSDLFQSQESNSQNVVKLGAMLTWTHSKQTLKFTVPGGQSTSDTQGFSSCMAKFYPEYSGDFYLNQRCITLLKCKMKNRHILKLKPDCI